MLKKINKILVILERTANVSCVYWSRVFYGGTSSRSYGVIVELSCIDILDALEIVLFIARVGRG